MKFKIHWDYSRSEIKAFVQALIDGYEKNKVLNTEDTDYSLFHKYSYEIPFGLHDGAYTYSLEMMEWEEKNKKPLYGLYIKAIQKDGRGPGIDWTSSQPVVKFYDINEMTKDQVVNDMYDHFQRNKKFSESLKNKK